MKHSKPKKDWVLIAMGAVAAGTIGFLIYEVVKNLF